MNDLPSVFDSEYDCNEFNDKFYEKINGENVKPVYDKNCVGFTRVIPKISKDQEISTFPFTSDYKEEINLSSYFKTEEVDNVVHGTFRGRLLQGERVNPPDGCTMYTAFAIDRPNGEFILSLNH